MRISEYIVQSLYEEFEEKDMRICPDNKDFKNTITRLQVSEIEKMQEKLVLFACKIYVSPFQAPLFPNLVYFVRKEYFFYQNFLILCGNKKITIIVAACMFSD